jgi:hypothetical protein
MVLITKGTVLRIEGYEMTVDAILRDGVLLHDGTVITFAEAETLV